MKVLFCFFMGGFIAGNLISQVQLPVKVSCIDQETKTLLNEAKIELKDRMKPEEKVFFSGTAHVRLNVVGGKASVYLKCSHDGYLSKDTLISLKLKNNALKIQEIVELIIPLNYDGKSTEEVIINATYSPDIIFASDTLSVADFEIDQNGNMFLLTYDKRLTKSRMLVHYDYEKQLVVDLLPIHHYVAKFVRDYRGKLYLQGEEKMLYIRNKTKLQLHEIEKEQFEELIAPIVDTTYEELFFTNYTPWYPALDYLGVRLTDTVYRTLAHVEDHEMMELYLAEYKYVDVRTKLWAWDMERSTGIDREIWVGAQNFVHSIYYEPTYGPMFMKKDTLYVFDHYNNWMYKVDPYNEFEKDSCAISYHIDARKTGWEQNMLQDEVTESIYCFFDNAGYVTLKELDTNNGALMHSFKLYHRYVEKVKIVDNEVYYIYRPFESAQKKYLYKESLTSN